MMLPNNSQRIQYIQEKLKLQEVLELKLSIGDLMVTSLIPSFFALWAIYGLMVSSFNSSTIVIMSLFIGMIAIGIVIFIISIARADSMGNQNIALSSMKHILSIISEEELIFQSLTSQLTDQHTNTHVSLQSIEQWRISCQSIITMIQKHEKYIANLEAIAESHHESFTPQFPFLAMLDVVKMEKGWIAVTKKYFSTVIHSWLTLHAHELEQYEKEVSEIKQSLDSSSQYAGVIDLVEADLSTHTEAVKTIARG